MGNCTELLNDIRNAKSTVKIYLKEECQNLLKNNNITEGVESALPYGSGEEGTDIILELIQSIAENKLAIIKNSKRSLHN